MTSRGRWWVSGGLAAALVLGLVGVVPVGVPALADPGSWVGRPPEGAGWLDSLNFYRGLAGLPTVAENLEWQPSLEAHAEYMWREQELRHSEDPASPWYTDEGDEAGRSSNIAACLSSSCVRSELEAIETWVSSPGHLTGMLRPGLQQSAYGEFLGDGTLAYNWFGGLDVLRGATSLAPSAPVHFPGRGTRIDLPSTAIVLQLPDDPDPDAVAVWNDRGEFIDVEVHWEGMEAGGTDAVSPVPGVVCGEIIPGIYDSTNAVALKPVSGLELGRRYWVTIRVNGSTHHWWFDVGEVNAATPNPLGHVEALFPSLGHWISGAGDWPGVFVVSDPVDTSTGALVDTWDDVTFPVTSLLGWNRTYSSVGTDRVGVLGAGWTTPLDVELLVDAAAGEAILFDAAGRRRPFKQDADTGQWQGFLLPGSLVETGSGFEWTDAESMVWAFDVAGHLTGWEDPGTGQGVQVVRDGAGAVTALVESTGRQLTFNYDAAGRVVQVSADDGRTVAYSHDTNGLATVGLPGGGQQSYVTDGSGLVTEIRDGAGRLVVTNSFDTEGRVVQQSLPGGNTVSFVYDDANLETKVTDDATGEVTTVRYDQNLRVQAITDPAGRILHRAFDEAGRLLFNAERGGTAYDLLQYTDGQVTFFDDGTGAPYEFTYDSWGRPTSATDPAGGTWTLTYDTVSRVPATVTDPDAAVTRIASAAGLPTRIVDADGVTTDLAWDARRMLTAVTSGGATTTVDYDLAGRPVRLTAPDGGVYEWGWNDRGDLVARTTPAGQTTWTYDLAGKVTSETDPLGHSTTYTYDPAGRLATETTPEGSVTEYAYTAAGEVASVTAPDGGVTTYTWGTLGRLTGETDPLGNATSYTYDPAGRLASETDPVGNTTSFSYTPAGQLASETDPLGNTTSYRYDPAGRLVSVTDPLGHTTTYSHDPTGRLVSTTDPEGRTWTQSWTPAGRLASRADPQGNATTYAYGPAGRLASVTDPLGRVTSYARDPVGRVTQITDPAGGFTALEYDLAGRVTARTTPAGLTSRWEYDAAGQVTAIETPQVGRTVQTWTPTGRLASTTDAAGATVTYRYDTVENLTEVTDRLGATTSYTYDLRGDRRSRTSAEGGATSWTHDPRGLMVSETDPLGNRMQQSWDPAGRLVRRDHPTGDVQTWAYDAAGRLVEHAWEDGAAKFAYDGSGRRATMVDDLGGVIYSYDEVGRLASVARSLEVVAAGGPGSHVTSRITPATTTYEWDAAGQLARMTYPLSTDMVQVDGDEDREEDVVYVSTSGSDGEERSFHVTLNFPVEYQRDPLGQVVSATTRDGVASYSWGPDGRLLTEQIDGQVTRSYSYTAGRLAGYHQAGVGLTDRDVTLTHDSLGRLIGVDDGTTAEQYTYDDASQLTGQVTTTADLTTATTWSYDPTGSRTAITVDGPTGSNHVASTYDLADQLTTTTGTTGTTTYTHDAAGRRTDQTGPAGTTTFGYDGRGKPTIRAVTSPAGAVATQQRFYDGDGRLAAVAVSTDDADPVVTHLLWDTLSPVEQVTATLADNVPTLYLNGPRRAFAVDPARTVHPYSYDHLGSALADPGIPGSVIGGAATGYSPFGEPDTPVVDGTALRFGYRGELHHGGQIHLRNREYDPAAGMFTTRDPLDGIDGTPTVANPYHYTDSNPLNQVDPLGLRPTDGTLQPHVPDHCRGIPQVTLHVDWWFAPFADTGSPCDRIVPTGNPPTADSIHGALDTLGFVPVVGEAFDGINALMYAVQGDTVNAGISLTAIIPVIGSAGTGARTASRLAPEAVTGGGGRLLWGSWNDYPKVTVGGREYAQIGDRLYSHHAVDRLQPSGLGAPAGATGAGRSISPTYVEDVISGSRGVPVKGPNGEPRLSFTGGSVQVITENGIVVTVITR